MVGLAMMGQVIDLRFILLFLAIAGGADMVSGIFRSAIWNQTIPDDIRGRMAGIELLSSQSDRCSDKFEAALRLR